MSGVLSRNLVYDADSCSDIICLHGGVCSYTESQKFYCECHENFYGPMCEYVKEDKVEELIRQFQSYSPKNYTTFNIYNYGAILTRITSLVTPRPIVNPNVYPEGIKNPKKDRKPKQHIIDYDDKITPTEENEAFEDPKYGFDDSHNETDSMVKFGKDNWISKNKVNEQPSVNQLTYSEEALLAVISVMVFLTFFVVLVGVVRINRKPKYVKVTDTFVPPLHVSRGNGYLFIVLNTYKVYSR